MILNIKMRNFFGGWAYDTSLG